MIDYKKLDINELIGLIRRSDNGAFRELVDRYTPMLSSVALGHVSPTLLFEELFSEGCVALHRATLSYDLSLQGEVTFGLYAKICVSRRVKDLVSRTGKDVEIVDTDVDTLSASSTIEERLIGRERMNSYLEVAHKILSEYEYKIFRAYINGERVEEIATRLCKDVKSVENAKARMLKKLREGSELFSDVK